MVWKTGWRGGKAANEGRPGSGALGHSAATVCNRHSGGPVTIPEGSGQGGGDVGARVRNRLSSSDSVVCVEGTGKQRVRGRPSVGLTTGQARRGCRHGGAVLSQWPRGLLHFLGRKKEISKSGPW
jgi:hypothetical protein